MQAMVIKIIVNYDNLSVPHITRIIGFHKVDFTALLTIKQIQHITIHKLKEIHNYIQQHNKIESKHCKY